ncbi:YlmH family RNA-binding protein [Salimicrobium salexigens]|uniref:RNA-binding protein YlmH, contains S4-like domain n=1 Tax=Salimicrobium salexigens TaxID=908941 RepID=A0ABY1KPV0_9BACI|nr:RNA-binding protein [Salimicrobium salexigens]SIS61805.1 RNA-binding protein YlmH, contains S4-like domain [Salimicrobium salexigens]
MEIYQHFRKEERPFIDQVEAWRKNVEMRFQRKLTDFLNPRERQIATSLLRNTDLQVEFSGEDDEERRRMIIAPEYEAIEEENFQLTLLEASYPAKFVSLEHRDVLGAFMSLGIKREKLGDLIVKDGLIHIIAAAEISDFIKMQLQQINKASVTWKEIEMGSRMTSEEEWKESSATVSSLRIDVVLKEIYNMPRKKSVMYIKGGQVKVNFRTVDDPSFLLEEGDLISLRGKGRSELTEVMGQTKKDKWRITFSVLS